MKGFNTLKLNTATIIDALQEYFNKRLSSTAGTQVITNVSYDSVGVYIVTIKEQEKTDVR